MKNQNDLIISIVAAVLGIGFSIAFFFMKRDPVTPAAPQAVVTTPLVYPAPLPVMSSGLPSASGGGGGGSPFGGGGFGGSGGFSLPGKGGRGGGPMGGPGGGRMAGGE